MQRLSRETRFEHARVEHVQPLIERRDCRALLRVSGLELPNGSSVRAGSHLAVVEHGRDQDTAGDVSQQDGREPSEGVAEMDVPL